MQKLILLFCLTLCFSALQAQKNVVSLDIENNDNYSSFSMLDSVVNNHTVFFTGENHNFRTSNYKLQLKMLKYLYQKTGVRHLFLEFGVSRGWLVNSYIQTGDTSIFKILEDYSYDEYALLYKGLMEFNKTLPEDKKIMVHGIDIERSYSTPIKAMSMILPDKKAPASILLNIETLKALAGKVDDEHNAITDENEEGKLIYSGDYRNTERYNTDNTLELIIADYDSLKSIYQTYLGDNAPLFDEIMDGVKAEFKRNEYLNSAAMQAFVYREQFMYEHLLALVKKYPGDKFYGQFGRCHTPVNSQDKWCDFYFFNSLATRLNTSEEDVLKNKVMSIGIYYPQSTSFEIGATADDNLEKLFEKHGKEGLKLLEIEKGDSLFKGVNDKYQYLIINYDAYKIEETTDPVVNNYYDSGFSYGITFPNIEAHAGFLFMNLENLSSTFTSHGLPIMKSPQMVYGGAVTLYEDWFMYGSVSFHVLPKTINRYNDTSQLSFSGTFLKGYLGYDATSNEIFNIFPRIGIGYGNLKFVQEFDNDLPTNTSSGIFNQGPSNTIEYSNSAILLDPGVDIRFNIRYIAIGLNAGYQIDLSEKSWISDHGGYINSSPKTSLSGWYAMLTFSLFYSY